MYLLYLYQYYLNLTAIIPREVLLWEITLYAKLQNYHFNRILELMLILVINGLIYQGRDIHSTVCQVWSESKIHV